MDIFGVGVPEVAVILLIAFIFIGPEKLPGTARTLGSWVREARKLRDEAASAWREVVDVGDVVKDTVQPAGTSNRLNTLLGLSETTSSQPTPPAQATTTAPAAADDPALSYPPPFAPSGQAPENAAAVELDYPAPFARG